MKLQTFTVRANDEVAPDIFKLTFEAPDLAAELKPGQFMSFKVPNDPSHIVRVPLSFSASNAETGTIETFFALKGKGTRQLAALKPGQSGEVLGPLGKGWDIDASFGRALTVAGGLGATPILAASRACEAANIPLDIIVGAKTARQLVGIEEFQLINCGSFTITTDDGTRGRLGLTTNAAEELFDILGYGQVFTCGPEPMMRGIARIAAENDARCQVSLERMMTCGFGACNTCNVALAAGGYARCCTDGPVFEAEVIAW